MIHYTYRIASLASDKYYFGVHSTHEDPLQDGYLGSGCQRFQRWKNYAETLEKEILGIYSTRAEAQIAEVSLIGDLWFSDKNCLNATAGGDSYFRYYLDNCTIHGENNHVRGECHRCSYSPPNMRERV